jgi:hypothetical protein
VHGSGEHRRRASGPRTVVPGPKHEQAQSRVSEAVNTMARDPHTDILPKPDKFTFIDHYPLVAVAACRRCGYFGTTDNWLRFSHFTGREGVCDNAKPFLRCSNDPRRANGMNGSCCGDELSAMLWIHSALSATLWVQRPERDRRAKSQNQHIRETPAAEIWVHRGKIMGSVAVVVVFVPIRWWS